MTLKRMGAALAAILALASGGTLANAAPAAAVEQCPANQLCLYAGTKFNWMDFQTGTVAGCWYWPNYSTTSRDTIVSYVNNLPVKATLWKTGAFLNTYISVATIRPGGFSTDATSNNEGAASAL